MNWKRVSLLFFALTWSMVAMCSHRYDARAEIDAIYRKYNIDREVASDVRNWTTNQFKGLFIEFEIPTSRRIYCSIIRSNVINITVYEKNNRSKKSVEISGIDKGLIQSFLQELLTYKYEPLSVTTGPKYVYVTILSTEDRSFKFDYPWWVSSRRSDIPEGMLLGLDTSVSNAYRTFTTVFSRYIFPNMQKLQSRPRVRP